MQARVGCLHFGLTIEDWIGPQGWASQAAETCDCLVTQLQTGVQPYKRLSSQTEHEKEPPNRVQKVESEDEWIAARPEAGAGANGAKAPAIAGHHR
eukprot:COSAG04_NODE_2043_length_4936_cov_7.083316_2_plen_96_part_00